MAQAMALVLSGGGGERLSVLTGRARGERACRSAASTASSTSCSATAATPAIERVGVITQHAPTSLHDHIGAGRPWDLDRRDAAAC